MQPEIILQSDLLDIIFENRNKAYGAYALRKEYNGRVGKGLLVVLIFVVVLFALNFLNKNFSSALQGVSISGQDTSEVILQPIQPPEKLKPVKSPHIATIKNTTIVLTSENNTDTIPSVEELDAKVAITTETRNGDSTIEITSPPPVIPLKEEVAGTSNETRAGENTILTRAEVMPEFPGGEAALRRFLSKNLRVPEEGLQQGERIKIVVQFIVDSEGAISGIKFIQPGGELFEHEILRVMKKMPKWRPGIQNGRNVAVYFMLPVVFEIAE